MGNPEKAQRGPELYQRGDDGYPIVAGQTARGGYGPIPEAELFSHPPSFARLPAEVHGWQWSTTFGRWSALVTFADGWHGFTYPAPRRLDVFDASNLIAEIEAKYPDPHQRRQLVRELAGFWGGAKCNEFGVIEPTEHVVLELPAHPNWQASIALALVPDDVWLMATRFRYPHGDGSRPITVSDRIAYTSKAAAIAAGAQELIAQFTRLRDGSSLLRADVLLANRMIDRLEALRDTNKHQRLT